ncbi:hypothetical protein BDZ94DRAFT_1257000 [Collybia nuda]|uniref:Uncharacterized protein n=1 Tax=Collybia nuda TaxID=64659 RepID=A0A9P5Y8F2_9AGAR|nr:hypothetical protein BDZ94DRAFT_1257000 [Collybia nuda]
MNAHSKQTTKPMAEILVHQIRPRMTDSPQGPIEGLSFKPLCFRDAHGRDVLFPNQGPAVKLKPKVLGSQACGSSLNILAPPPLEGDHIPEEVLDQLERLMNVIQRSVTHRPLGESIFNYLITVAGLSRQYSCDGWETWAIRSITSLVASPESPLLCTTSSETFVRLIQLAKIYNDGPLGVSVQKTWLFRLNARGVSPALAIIMADDYNLRPLLSRALYLHLLQVAPRISNSQRIDVGSPLNHQQNLRIFSGYHSLSGYWARLCKNPPEFPGIGGCKSHTRCLTAWKSAWSGETPEECDLSVDVMTRLQFVADRLGNSSIVGASMSDECRNSALAALVNLRKGLWENMHHYFDL